MQLVSRKNFLIFLASILVVALGYMAMTLSKQALQKPKTFDSEIQQIQQQSSSDAIPDIEKDLNETNLTDIDRELQDIENELNQTY